MASDVFPVVGALIAQFCIKGRSTLSMSRPVSPLTTAIHWERVRYSPVVRHLAVAAFDDCSIGKVVPSLTAISTSALPSPSIS